jgi:hypothetical protein
MPEPKTTADWTGFERHFSEVGLPSNLCDALLTGVPTPPPNSDADERLEVEAKSHGDPEQSSPESPQSPHVHSPPSPQTLECPHLSSRFHRFQYYTIHHAAILPWFHAVPMPSDT